MRGTRFEFSVADDNAIRTLDNAIYIPDDAILHTQEKLIWDIAYRIPEAYSVFPAARRLSAWWAGTRRSGFTAMHQT